MSLPLDLLASLPGGPLLLRMTLVAMFVVLVALLAERLGPFLGGMVASLPLYTGPIYLMLALEHEPAYLAAAMLGSLTICGAMPVYVLAYCVAARRFGTLPSVAAALGAWAMCAALVQWSRWSVVEALLFVAPVYAVAVPLARGFTRGIAVRPAKQGWFDLFLRAILCGALSGVVVAVARHLPAQLTGILSVLPILMTSLALVLQPRIGGPATAALMAHTLGGLVGMVLAFALVHVTILEWGVWPALGAGLAVTVAWNVMLIAVKRLGTSSRAGAGEARREELNEAASAPAPAPLPPPPIPESPVPQHPRRDLPPPAMPRRPPAPSPPRR